MQLHSFVSCVIHNECLSLCVCVCMRLIARNRFSLRVRTVRNVCARALARPVNTRARQHGRFQMQPTRLRKRDDVHTHNYFRFLTRCARTNLSASAHTLYL